MKTIRIGTRQSDLAMTQTEWVITKLRHAYPELKVETKSIITKGDRILNVTLSKVGGKGLFVKEIEQALLEQEIDVAIHSMKDLPGEMADGLTLAAISKREDPRDCLISRDGKTLSELPAGAVVGTSSLRRQAQILAYRSDLNVEPVRGNIGTRLRKMREGQFDAILLAAAGLHRVGWQNLITEYLPVDLLLPAVGQGALGIQCRAGDDEVISVLKTLNDPATAFPVTAERAFLNRLEGDCQVPVGAFGTVNNDGNEVTLTGLVADPHAVHVYRRSASGSDPVQLGQQLADEIEGMGADKVLASLREESSSS